MTLWNIEWKTHEFYLLMLAIGKFDQRTEKTKCGTELELYLETKDG
jgi:aminopeptidase N